MSRRGEVGYPVYAMTNTFDYGGEIAFASAVSLGDGGTIPAGTRLRPDVPSGGTDGYTNLVYIGAGQGFLGRKVSEGDMIVLVHSVTTTSTALGQPNNFSDSNPWQPVKLANGTNLNHSASGPTGAIRVRAWWKFATLADSLTTKLYRITNSVFASCGLGYWVIPRNAFDDDPALDTDLGNPGRPAPHVPVITAIRTGAGGNPAAPAVTLPNVGNRFRNVGILGQIVAQADSNSSVAPTGNTAAAIDPQDYAYCQVVPDQAWVFNGYTDGVQRGMKPQGSRHTTYFYMLRQKLDGKASFRALDYSKSPNVNQLNNAFVSATFNIIMPYVYPDPTPGRTWADIADEFTDGTDLATKWYLGTNRPDQSLPAIVDGRLRIRSDEQIVHRYKTDFTKQALVVGPIQYDYASTSGCNLYITLTITIDDIHTVEIKMFTVPSANGADIRWQLVDDGYTAAPALDSRGLVAIWDPIKTKYWRIRESNGILSFEVSPDKLRWTGTFWGHELLKDQLTVLRPHFYVLGDGEAYIDGVNPYVAPDNRQIPYETSWEFMGAPPELRDRWHGRDVLVGIADQGTTKAVRDAQNVTMRARTYLVDPPTGGKEIHDYATHGCLVTPCGVPISGQFVEAVISGSDGYSSASLIMAGILWCARQGAKAINLSFGGGGDDPIFDAVFAYLASNFNTDISISAGNDYLYGISLPAAYSIRYSNVHSVIAWDEVTNQRAPFSNHHELASVCAPGRFVGGRHPSGEPILWNGTSAAAPHRANCAARVQTARRYSAAQAGAAIDRNARPTGQVASEQGGGAVDLARAIAVAGDSTGTTNIPAISMPRFDDGEWAGVTDKLNAMIGAVEAQGRACLVRYAGRSYLDDGTLVETNATVASGQYGVVPWTSCDADTYAGMWDGGATVVIPTPGLYLVVLHVRYGLRLLDGSTATGAPYNAGLRGAMVLVNGTDITANMVAWDRQPAALDSDGVTCVVTALLPLDTDDYLYAQTWQTSGATIQCLQNDYGGTWMLVSRVAPRAPSLEGALDPVTAMTAIGSRWDQATVAWTPPATSDLLGVLLRRRAGTTPPVSYSDTDSTYLGLVKPGTTSFTDRDLAGNATYSYAAWARSPAGYSPRAIATATTSTKPATPAPVTDITSSRRTTGVITLAWTTPANPDPNGVTRAGIMVRRADGAVPPPRPESGVLVADLPATATGYSDTTVIANGKLYAYSIFTYRSEQVYSAPATHVRSTAYNTTMYGGARAGSRLPDGYFSAKTPVQSNVLPTITRIAYQGAPVLVGVFFWVTRPAVFKGHRFLRPQPNIGQVRAALFEFEAAPTFDGAGAPLKPWAYRRTPDVKFATTAAFQVWEESIHEQYVPLTPYQIYVAVTMFPAEFGEAFQFFSEDNGWAQQGLMDPTELLYFPGTADEHFYETLGDWWPKNGNMAGTRLQNLAYADPYYPNPLYDGPIPNQFVLRPATLGAGDDGIGRCIYTDVIVNEDT